MLDFSVSFYAIASLRFLQAERFPKLGVQCLIGEHQTRIPFFCPLRRRQTSVLLDVIFANNFCVSICLLVSSKSTLGLLVFHNGDRHSLFSRHFQHHPRARTKTAPDDNDAAISALSLFLFFDEKNLFFPVLSLLIVILLVEACTSFFLMETTGP